MSKRFICDDSNKNFKEWRENFDEFAKEAETELNFLKKRATAMFKRRDAKWDELFDILKKDGLVPKEYKRDTIYMEINAEHNQLFMDTKKESSDPLHKLFEKLFT